MRWKFQHTLYAIILVLCFVAYGRESSPVVAQTTSFQTPASTNATWTAATAVGTVVKVSTATLSSVMVTMNGTGTLTGGSFAFYVSDDPVTVSSPGLYQASAFRVDTGVSDTTVNVAPFRQAWQADTDGWKLFAIQLTSPITGSGSLAIRLSPTAAPGGVPAIQGASTRPLTPTSMLGSFFGLIGSFGRRITSHGTALDTYVVNSYDPCQTPLKGNRAISQTASSILVAAAQGKRVFICSFFAVSADAELISLVEGLGTAGSACTAIAVAVVGGSTAATGMSFSANGGTVVGNGEGSIGFQTFPGLDICLLQSGTGRVAGNLTYVWQ